MNLTTRHFHMLRAMAQKPRTAKDFTGNTHDALSPNACAAHLNRLIADDLAEVNSDGLYMATEAGRELLARPRVKPRTFCNATTRGNYRSPAWSVREGSDAAFRLPSRGIGC